jgi:hypothetical protein
MSTMNLSISAFRPYRWSRWSELKTCVAESPAPHLYSTINVISSVLQLLRIDPPTGHVAAALRTVDEIV